MKKVGIIQSNYIPWRGYFDFINSVDIFVILDDTQYTCRDWRNRNKIKTPNGLTWLSVPVIHTKRDQLIQDTKIDYTQKWQKSHLNTFKNNYAKAPFSKEIFDLYMSIIENKFETISELNVCMIKAITNFLQIKTPIVLSAELNISGVKTEKIIGILKKLNATSYLSGPQAKNYIEESYFISEKIDLEYKVYDYVPYSQLWGDFSGNVSILDLLAIMGKNSKEYIVSNSPNEVVLKNK